MITFKKSADLGGVVLIHIDDNLVGSIDPKSGKFTGKAFMEDLGRDDLRAIADKIDELTPTDKIDEPGPTSKKKYVYFVSYVGVSNFNVEHPFGVAEIHLLKPITSYDELGDVAKGITRKTGNSKVIILNYNLLRRENE